MVIDYSTLSKLFEGAGLFIVAWLIHLLPFLLIALPVWIFARKRVEWNKWDFSIVIIPFAVWAFLMLAHSNSKGLGNWLEGLLIGCIASLTPIIRVIIKNKINQIRFAQGLMVALCVIAIGCWAFIPASME